MIDARVAAAISPFVQALRADGADLHVELVDPAQALIRLRVELEGAGCQECVLPPAQLAAVIGRALREHIDSEFELELEDPRGTVRQLLA